MKCDQFIGFLDKLGRRTGKASLMEAVKEGFMTLCEADQRTPMDAEKDLEIAKNTLKNRFGIDFDKDFSQKEQEVIRDYIGYKTSDNDRRYEYYNAVQWALSDAALENEETMRAVSDKLKELGENLDTFTDDERNVVNGIVSHCALERLDHGWPVTKNPYFIVSVEKYLKNALRGDLDDYHSISHNGRIFNLRHAGEIAKMTEEYKESMARRKAELEMEKRREREERERLKKEDPDAFYDKYVRNTIDDPGWRGPNGTWSLD